VEAVCLRSLAVGLGGAADVRSYPPFVWGGLIEEGPDGTSPLRPARGPVGTAERESPLGIYRPLLLGATPWPFP